MAETIIEDIEEYNTTLFTSADCSATSLPPLEVPPIGLVHDSPLLYTTVIDSMKQAVPIEIKASTVGTKKSGLFFTGEAPLPPGEMIFLTNPLVMARSPDDDQTMATRPRKGPLRDTDVCDYCFKSPQTFTEKVASESESGNPVLPPARRCTGCNLMSFCNKTCHQKAWKQFHRFECGLLKTLQRRDPAFLLHLRLLLMDKADTVPDNVMKVIRDLSMPFKLPLQPPLSHNVKNCALHAYHLLSLENRDLTFIRDVLCRVLANQAVVATADETAIVHCFDISLAMLNHLCAPNAFVFVEGRQARVRSLHTILPGEEITVALVDTRLDVESRREALRLQTLCPDYVCNCEVCKRDADAMKLISGESESQLAALKRFYAGVVPKAVQLIHDIKRTAWDKAKTDLVHQFVTLAEGEFLAHFTKGPMDNVTYKPIPWLRMAGAAMFLEIRQLESALYYAVLSFMFRERQVDPLSVTDLRILVNTLRAICELPESAKQYRSLFASHRNGFPTRRELGAFTVGCTIALGLLAIKVYGPKLGFVRAVLRWGREGETLCAPLEPCNPEFNTAFHSAQHKILKWCLGNRIYEAVPIREPTRAEYDALTDILRAREEQLEQSEQTAQNGQPDEAELAEPPCGLSEDYERVEKRAKTRESKRSGQSGQSGRSELSEQSTHSTQSTQSTRSTRSTQSGRPDVQEQQEAEDVSMVLLNYEQKMRVARNAESIMRREQERRKQKSSRKEEEQTVNSDLENKLQAVFEAGLRIMGENDMNSNRNTEEPLDQVDKKMEREYGREGARSSTVEEVCRVQMDW
ncbi:uncharacterized protein SPSK_07041 [Sporothrix schenckii 1099-18]|uniref:Uncharacterized protein n=1 Tax=Sporothrix schenckii 1099-18 TaxID=1397361 RepID=A0A0F2MHH7_SPOSC|nr:uncharacterized protein SPSK_07041 [Sporothrix schenckii 1099-18]KJR88315.1 hypothetical protein SPSK_07041 [Sporothrix schenckii 1099-18]